MRAHVPFFLRAHFRRRVPSLSSAGTLTWLTPTRTRNLLNTRTALVFSSFLHPPIFLTCRRIHIPLLSPFPCFPSQKSHPPTSLSFRSLSSLHPFHITHLGENLVKYGNVVFIICDLLPSYGNFHPYGNDHVSGISQNSVTHCGMKLTCRFCW